MIQKQTQIAFGIIISLLLSTTLSDAAPNRTDQITHGAQKITINYQASLTQNEREITYKWLNKVTSALRTVYGEFPKDYFQLTIQRGTNRSGPVPWGQVERGEPTKVLLVINPEHGYDALISDWTAFHELSHLLIPYRGHGNVWFSEGLATYYQNIIQARSGLLTETEMWGKLAAGFERGEKQHRWGHLKLTDLSDTMRENRQFMRVHWSGVLYWLSADVELRKQNKGTLDSALKQLKACCESSSMSAKAIAQKLDELTQSDLFVPLFETYCDSYQIPDYQPILTELGIEQYQSNRNIVLRNTASQAEFRKQIYRK